VRRIGWAFELINALGDTVDNALGGSKRESMTAELDIVRLHFWAVESHVIGKG
jgi:hypothetical protein